MPNDPRNIPPPGDGLQYLSCAEAARLVKRSPKTLQVHARRGVVPAIRDAVSGHWLFVREDLLRTYVPGWAGRLVGNVDVFLDEALREMREGA